jgi:transposase-like protein
MAKRRTFSPEFKSKLVLELLREERSLGEIANEHGISPNQLRNWKIEFLKNASRAFSESRDEKEIRAKEKEMDGQLNVLMAKVGQLTIENDWLKKKSKQVFADTAEIHHRTSLYFASSPEKQDKGK